jgi:hypothetical protein
MKGNGRLIQVREKQIGDLYDEDYTCIQHLNGCRGTIAAAPA